MVSESQVSGRGLDPQPATRLQGKATWPDGNIPSDPDMFPDAHGGRVCTLAVAIVLLRRMVAISLLSAWLWDRFRSMVELGRWSRVAFQQHKRSKGYRNVTDEKKEPQAQLK